MGKSKLNTDMQCLTLCKNCDKYYKIKLKTNSIWQSKVSSNMTMVGTTIMWQVVGVPEIQCCA